MTIPVIDGIAEVIDRYDAVLCDLWGCVHDGVRPYPGVVDCLRRLRDSGRRIVMLSNAPRQNWAVAKQLDAIGLPEDCYDAIVSSGDATVAALNERVDCWHAALGRRYYHLGPERSAMLVDALIGETVGFDQAEVIVNTGLVDDARETPDDYRELLARAFSRGLPMVCANPDVVVVHGDRQVFCAGALAHAYEAMGGQVRWHGKPYESVYEIAFKALPGVARDRVMMVGDGMHTDIAGARGIGIDSLWIVGGIHAAEVGQGPGRAIDGARITDFCTRHDEAPTAALARLVW